MTLTTSVNGQTAQAMKDSSPISTGLHGHVIGADSFRAVVSEFLGTFVLVLTIIGTAIAAQLSQPVAGAPYSSLAVPLAGGFALVVVVASLGHLSGAHLNPAVTVGLALNRRFPGGMVPAYLLAQLAGAIAAALCVWMLFGSKARSVASLGATVPAPGVGLGRVFAAEGIVTFVLVLVVLSVATERRVPQGLAAIAIGLALAAAIFISGPISGAGVNPARALGPMIVAGTFSDWWVYVVAPLAGGALAATAFHLFLYDPAPQGLSESE
jgi:MIP family channel proteins